MTSIEGTELTAEDRDARMAELRSFLDHNTSRTEARQALALARSRGPGMRRMEFEAGIVLARVLGRQGRFGEAEAQLASSEKLGALAALPDARQMVAATRGGILVGRGEYARAIPSLRTAIDTLTDPGPSATAQRDSMRIDLISVLAVTGRHDEAIEEGRRLIAEAGRRKENSDLLVALAKVALARAQGDDFAEAEKLLLEAQPVIRASLGENHSRHLNLLNELLRAAFKQGDWPRAIEYAQTAHEGFRAKFGPEHVLTYVSLVNWARTLDEAGRPDDALDKARSGYQQLNRLVGPASPQTQDAASVLALIELELGHIAEAMALIEPLQAAAREPGHEDGALQATVDALRGIALQRQGDTAAARPLLDSALSAMKEETSQAHPSRIYTVTRAARARIR